VPCLRCWRGCLSSRYEVAVVRWCEGGEWNAVSVGCNFSVEGGVSNGLMTPRAEMKKVGSDRCCYTAGCSVGGSGAMR
jgi:hypothetical protein